MTDRQALLRAVLAEPADDLPRLVLADRLDEAGEPERAGYVRASVRLAEVVAAGEMDTDEYVQAVVAVGSVPTASLWAWACGDGLPLSPAPAALTRDTAAPFDAVRDVPADLSVGDRRGFPEADRCRLRDWVGLVHRAVPVAPLARFEATDRRPYHHRPREWVWRLPEGAVGGPSCTLPAGVFAHLPGRQSTIAVYRSSKQAADALSAAGLTFARAYTR